MRKYSLLVLLVLLPMIVLADVRWLNGGSDAGIVTTVNCAAGAVCSRSGSVGTITIALDGGVLAGTAPITVTPGTPTLIGCIMATGSVSGCMSNTTQTIAGHKTWTDAQTWNSQVDIQATSVVRGGLIFLAPTGGNFQQQTNGGTFLFQDNLDATSVGSGFVMQSTVPRTAGFMSSATNGIYTTYKNDVGGNVFSGCGPNPDGGFNFCGGFVDGSGVSGNLSLTTADGLYPFIAGKLPRNYYGHHGAVTLGNTNADPFWLLELYNAQNGTAADIKTVFNYQGGMTQPAGYSLAQFAPCGNVDLAPTDGGNQGTDAGYAFDGTLMYAHDEQRWYYCNVPNAIGLGTWTQVGSSGGVSDVTGSGNIASSGGVTPNITFTGVLPIANGGTNSGTALPGAGGVVWNDGTKLLPIAAGSTGECLRSNGASAPAFGACDVFDGGGTGSVTDFLFTNANGVTGVVTDSTTTPTLVISLGAITPTTIVASSTIAGSNLSGTNTGDLTLASFGSTPATAGASLSSQVLTLQPADGTHGGGVSTTTQTFAGAKTFSTPIALASGGTNNNITASYGAIAYSDASKLLLSGIGTVGQCLLSGAAGAPTWGSCSTTAGTVTSVSVVTANGVSASTANPTTTPAMTFTLGNITPNSVTSATYGFPGSSGTITDDFTFTTISNPLVTAYLNTTTGGLDMTAVTSNVIQSDATDANTSSSVAAMEFGQSQSLTAGDLSFGWKSGNTRLCKMTNAGAFNCASTLTGSNLSGTNTGDLTLASFGSTPSANAASLSSQVLTMQPADATHPGGIALGNQTLGSGTKTADSLVATGELKGGNTHVRATRSDGVAFATSNATFIFNTETYDTLSEYSPSTGIFTATKAGYYLISGQVAVSSASLGVLGAPGTFSLGDELAISVMTGCSGSCVVNSFHIESVGGSLTTSVMFASISTTLLLAANDTIALGAAASSAYSSYPSAGANYITIDRIP